jgi:hypothetical protein
MRVKMFLFVFAIYCTLGALCYAADAMMLGTWKLNEAKSNVDPKMGKNVTVTYASEGDNVKVTVDGFEPDGKPRHTEWVGKFDDKEYPVTGDVTTDSRSYKIVDDHTLFMINKKGGKETSQGTVVLSVDGKTRTVHLTGKDSKGNKIELNAVYDKE